MNFASWTQTGMQRQTNASLQTTRSHAHFAPVDQAAFCLALVFLISLLLPQLNAFWLRGVCPVFAAWLLLVVWNGSLLRVSQQIQGRLLLAGTFLVVLLLNRMFRNGPYSHQFIAGFINGAASMTVVGYYAVKWPDLLPLIRSSIAVIFGLALLPSLPILYHDPWAARFLSSSTAWDQQLANPDLPWQGVGNYIQYTGIAVVMSALIASLFEQGPIRRFLFLGALAILAASVTLAMFTMASVFMLSAIVASAAALPFLARFRYRWLAAVLAAGMLLALPSTIEVLCDKYEAVEFVHDKFFRLLNGISEVGFEQGDESMRVEMLIDTCDTILKYPWLGVGFDADRNITDQFVGGHSSLVDHWAMFGLVGYAPLFLLQFHFTRIAMANWLARRRNVTAWGTAFAWAMYWLASVWNPTTFTILPYMMIFTDCHRRKGFAPPAHDAAGRPASVGRPHWRLMAGREFSLLSWNRR